MVVNSNNETLIRSCLRENYKITPPLMKIKCGHLTSSMSIVWVFVTKANSQALCRPTESETLGVGAL